MHNLKAGMLLSIAFLTTYLPAFGIEENLDEIILDTKEGEKIEAGIFHNEYLTGEWFGLRSKLREKGLDIQSSYTITPIQSIPTSNARRADDTRKSHANYKGIFNLSAEFDTEKADLYKGGKFFILYQAANRGHSPNDTLGSYLTIDSTDTGMESINQLSEYWYEQTFFDKFSLRVGKQDVNRDFQSIESGADYVNLSFSYIPTTPIPFYPAGKMGARLKYQINDLFALQSGIYSGGTKFGTGGGSFFKGKDGYFAIAEADFTPEIKEKNGKYMLGGWMHTKDAEKFSGGYAKENFGAYFMAEQKLYNEKNNKDQGLSLILQGGWAKDDINAVNKYYGLGLLYKGPFKTRDKDEIGLGIANAGFSSKNPDRDKKSEKLFELFYKIHITDWLYFQPDIQYILNPNSTKGSAFAFGIRTNIIF